MLAAVCCCWRSHYSLPKDRVTESVHHSRIHGVCAVKPSDGGHVVKVGMETVSHCFIVVCLLEISIRFLGSKLLSGYFTVIRPNQTPPPGSLQSIPDSVPVCMKSRMTLWQAQEFAKWHAMEERLEPAHTRHIAWSLCTCNGWNVSSETTVLHGCATKNICVCASSGEVFSLQDKSDTNEKKQAYHAFAWVGMSCTTRSYPNRWIQSLKRFAS